MPHAREPVERVTHAHVRDVELPGLGTLALITLAGEVAGRPPTLGTAGLTGLREVLRGQRRRAADGEICAVALTGTGAFFLAGADLREVASLTARGQGLALGRLGHDTYRLLGELGVPTLAVVNGPALGGGLELALHCTYRAVGSDVTALALPEASLGLVPGWGGCALLPALVGTRGALDLVLERPLAGNRMTGAAEALSMGLVDLVVDQRDLLGAALAWFGEVLAGRRGVTRREPDAPPERAAILAAAATRLDRRLHGAAPAPVRALALLVSEHADRDAAFAAEDEALADLLLSPELRAGLYAFDLTRAARRPVLDTAHAQPVQVLGVVGAGLMAAQIAVLAAVRLGVPVRMREVDEERSAAGRARVAELVARLVAGGRLSTARAERVLAAVTVGPDLADLADADLVIEAVSEVLEVKQRVFAELEDTVRPDTVLATNTSALSVTAMAADLRHPERVVGLHVFNPVAQMPLVEVVRADRTGERALATAVAASLALGKSPVTVADRPGFVVNRLLLRLLGEVLATVERGTDVRVADAALRPLGLPMGPFALLQLVGLPVALHVLEALHGGLGVRFARSPGLELLAAQGHRVVGPAGSGREHEVDPRVQDAFGAPVDGRALDEAGVLAAVLGALTQEIGLMLAEGVVSGPEQVDVCLVLGAGWPLHLGGICPYLDRTGWSERVLGRRLLPAGRADAPRP